MSPTILRILRELRRDTDRTDARPLSYYLHARRRSRGGGVTGGYGATRDERL